MNIQMRPVATLIAVSLLFGTMMTVGGCGGGGGGADAGGLGGAAAGNTGTDGGSGTGGSTGSGGSMRSGGSTGSGGGGGSTGSGGAAGGTSGAVNWHCAETAGVQCLCDSVIAYPQTSCQATFTCCYSYALGGARQGCVCENRDANECNVLVTGTSCATRRTTCPPP